MTNKINQQLKEMKKTLIKNIVPKKGEIWWANIPQTNGSIQYGKRPILIISNDLGNLKSTIVTYAPITTKTKNNLPTHFDLIDYFDLENSTVMLEQINTISKTNLLDKKHEKTDFIIEKSNQCLLSAMGIEADIVNNNLYQLK